MKWPLAAVAFSIGAAAGLPFLYWDEAAGALLRGGSLIYVTWLGLIVYSLLVVCPITLLIALWTFRRSSRQVRPLVLVLAIIPLVVILVKWAGVLIDWRWFELFHNRMGLGMEILGPIPNFVIDVGLFIVFFAAMTIVWRGTRDAVSFPRDDGPFTHPVE